MSGMRKQWWITASCVVAISTLLTTSATAQTGHDLVVADYQKRRTAMLAEAGQRHLQLGSWARDKGLVPQATAQFLRAVVVSEGRNPGAVKVLGIMRGFGPAFWKKRRKQPSTGLIADFGRRLAAIETKTRKGHMALAHRAARAGLVDESKQHWRRILALGGEVEVDGKGVVRLDGKEVPATVAGWLRDQTTEVNNSKLAFEAAGKSAPQLENLKQHESELLVVRTDLAAAQARKLHALGSALFPHLRKRLDGEPSRRLQLYVFARHDDYQSYLEARRLDGPGNAKGLCDYGAFQTLVSAEGLASEDLHALVLHELSHLFFFATAPAVMPDWFAEGFAETFGGQGTFAWDGKKLQVGGMMRRDRIDDLKKDPMPLRDLLRTGAAALLARDQGRGHRFYAQCWALHRFLLQERGAWRARFLFFEAECRGGILGAPERGRPTPNPVPATAVFQRLFAQDLDRIEQEFRAWLAAL